jgi:naphthoate synthase
MADTAPEDIIVEQRGAVLWLTINREAEANTLRFQTATELIDQLQRARTDRSIRAVVLTAAGDRFFCIGGVKDEQVTFDQSAVFPVVDLYEIIDTMTKPVIAAVNGYAVGGGNVLHTVCDLTIASDRAVFRQVGPSVGSFDAGFGTWYLEDTIGRKRAKEMWYLNRKYSAEEALRMGLVNEVVEHERLQERVTEILEGELLQRGSQAIASLKAAFSARNTGVVGQSRIAHDLLLTRYLVSEEAKELSTSFEQKREPDQDRFDR